MRITAFGSEMQPSNSLCVGAVHNMHKQPQWALSSIAPIKSKIPGINPRLFQVLKPLGLSLFDLSSPRQAQSTAKDYIIVAQLAPQEHLRLSPEVTRLYFLTITHVYRKLVPHIL
jgi:hypothetical protein